MFITDMKEEYYDSFCNCLADDPGEWKCGVAMRKQWYEKMKPQGLKVKLAVTDDNQVAGMIQFSPLEQTFNNGQDLFFVHCIWIYQDKTNKNFRKRGAGKALLKAAEEESKYQGAKGLVVWGVSLPFFMKASWFKKQGYIKIDKEGMAVLLWKPFTDDAKFPQWDRVSREIELVPGIVKVTAFTSGWCLVQNANVRLAEKAAVQFGDKVVFQEIDLFDEQNRLKWGSGDAVYIDKKEITNGPPLTYDKFYHLIAKRVKKLKA
ncbi:MAG: GNAT family N-acetyltransferase [Spirochaetes bacterium]|nr:GNAT family N-acetyltransferase [Spirochaetota bacterium]